MSLRNVLSLTLLLTLCAASSLAQEKIKVAGTMTMTIARQDTIAVSVGETHILSLMQSTGTNAVTGATKFMDGAQAVNTSFSDLVLGNGPHHGYLVLTKDGNSVFCEWKGTVTTVPAEPEPVTSFEGTFVWTGGTGEHATITGSGTYKGRFTSKTAYTAEWSGEYSLGK